MNIDSSPIALMNLMPCFSRAGLKIWAPTKVYVGNILVDADDR
jgi:hypothetical protein